MTSAVLVTGTDTDVGKTIVTATIAAAAVARGSRVCAYKVAQTDVRPADRGDVETIHDLSGVPASEGARLPDALSPEAAAARAGVRLPTLAEHVSRIEGFASDLVVVEGAGGALVRLGEGWDILDLAVALDAPLVIVARAGLGTLNHTGLTVAAARSRGAQVAGIVIGSMPTEPDLAASCNLTDLPRLTDVPIIGIVPEGAGQMAPAIFRERARGWVRCPDAAARSWSPSDG